MRGQKICDIVAEDVCNDTYVRHQMYQALKIKYLDEDIPGERTYRIMEEVGDCYKPNRKPRGSTKTELHGS